MIFSDFGNSKNAATFSEMKICYFQSKEELHEMSDIQLDLGTVINSYESGIRNIKCPLKMDFRFLNFFSVDFAVNMNKIVVLSV